MHNTAIATSIRLPDKVNLLIEKITKKHNISKSDFMRKAILEKVEDELDIIKAEEILSNSKTTYTLGEIKRELGLEG